MTRLREWLHGLPPLTAVAAAMYGSGCVLLCMAAITWQPGKNPRAVIIALAVAAAVFMVWALLRGRRFSQAEALVMVTLQLAAVVSMTWTTQLMFGALANGTVLPITGVYVIWFVHPAAGRAVLYLGLVGWFAAIVHHDDASLVPFAATIAIQTIVATEIFARIKLRMDRLALTDPLTSTLNRRGITEVLERELGRSTRRQRPMSIVAIDLDGLREVNNTHGHRAGDEVLTSVTQHWIGGVRRQDSVGRTGGDEFLLVLPETTLEQAHAFVGRLRVDSPGSWSAGVAMAKPDDSAESVLERADGRLYDAKASRQAVRASGPADVPTWPKRPSVRG